jgi:structural maintenance of chromosome 2
MQLSHRINSIFQSDYAFSTNFRDPEPNFDRRRVRGRVFELIQPIEEKYIKALDQVAGSKLKNIIVDNEHTSKLLMKKSCFSFFVNLMPNNKMTPIVIQDHIVKEAERIAKELGGFAIPASRLVKYDPELRNSIEFVFGGSVSLFFSF